MHHHKSTESLGVLHHFLLSTTRVPTVGCCVIVRATQSRANSPRLVCFALRPRTRKRLPVQALQTHFGRPVFSNGLPMSVTRSIVKRPTRLVLVRQTGRIVSQRPRGCWTVRSWCPSPPRHGSCDELSNPLVLAFLSLPPAPITPSSQPPCPSWQCLRSAQSKSGPWHALLSSEIPCGILANYGRPTHPTTLNLSSGRRRNRRLEANLHKLWPSDPLTPATPPPPSLVPCAKPPPLSHTKAGHTKGMTLENCTAPYQPAFMGTPTGGATGNQVLPSLSNGLVGSTWVPAHRPCPLLGLLISSAF